MTSDRDVDALLPLPPITFHILMALTGTDKHGYAIIQDIEQRTNGEVMLNAGTLYRSIQRMLEQGLIEVNRRRVKDVAAVRAALEKGGSGANVLLRVQRGDVQQYVALSP